MGYAVRKDGAGWRAVSDVSDCSENENYSDEQPVFSIPDHMPMLTQRQLWLTALQAGITEEMVVAAVMQIADAEEREWTLIEIRKSQDYVYDHPAIAKIRTMMGLPEEQFKVMWRWAATL